MQLNAIECTSIFEVSPIFKMCMYMTLRRAKDPEDQRRVYFIDGLVTSLAVASF